MGKKGVQDMQRGLHEACWACCALTMTLCFASHCLVTHVIISHVSAGGTTWREIQTIAQVIACSCWGVQAPCTRGQPP